MESIFIHAKEDMIAEKNDGIKNSKEKKEIKCKEVMRNICESLTYEDNLVKFS